MTGKLLPEVYWARNNIEPKHEQWTYIEAYIIGDFFDDAKFRGHVMGEMIARRSTWHITFADDAITRIWEGTPEKSPLRIVTLAWMMATWNREAIIRILERDVVPRDFIREALVMLMQGFPLSLQSACDIRLRRLLLPDQNDDESSKSA
jgi:hypothetical protein